MFPELSHGDRGRSHPIPDPAMPSSTFNSSGPIVQKLKQRHWLKQAEYISLVSAAVGSVVVALSGQAFYGVAPLTVALSLNVANRYRIEQEVERSEREVAEMRGSMDRLETNAVRAIWLIRQQLSDEIAALREQQEERPEQESLEAADRTKEVALLAEDVASVQDNISRALEEMREQLRQEIAATQEDLQWVGAQVREIQQAIASLQKGQPIPPYQPDVDLGELQAQVNLLSQEHQQIIKPHLKRLILAIKQLQTLHLRTLSQPPQPLSREEI